MRASKLRLPDSTAAQTRSFFDDRLRRSSGEQVAGVADAGRAAVGGDAEAELLEVRQQAGLRQVLGDDARAGRERGLDVRLDREAALDRLLGEQARGEQHARVRGVGARGDRGDQHVAVADRGRVHVGRRPVGHRAVGLHLLTSRGAPGRVRVVPALRARVRQVKRWFSSAAGRLKPFSATGLLKSVSNCDLTLPSSMRSCGRFGPASDGATVARSSVEHLGVVDARPSSGRRTGPAP